MTGRSWDAPSKVAASIVVVLIAGCASLNNQPGTFTARFVQNPNNVWQGIHVTLETLEYVVESADRDEGTIRAAKPADGNTPWVALEINQVMYTDDQVDVYVRGVAEDPSNAPEQDVLDKAAQDFVTVLRRKLGN